MSSQGIPTASGVHATELPAFPPAIVGVQTAVPIFIGYTEYARDPSSQQQLYLQAVQVGSMADYHDRFGHAYDPKYATMAGDERVFDFQAVNSRGEPGFYSVGNTEAVHFNMVMALRLFYANGGGDCHVVSVADYGGRQSTTPFTGRGVQISRQALLDGLAVAKDMVGPTMIVVPDACLLSGDDYGAVAVAELNQAAELQDRVAILDLPGALDPATWSKAGLAAQRDAFHAAIAPAAPSFSYGTAYAPAVRTTILTGGAVDYTNLQATADGSALLKDLLTAQNDALHGDDRSRHDEVTEKLNVAFPDTPPDQPLTPDQTRSLSQHLAEALPLLSEVEGILLHKLNMAAPSGLIAGVWASNDVTRGVWNAPANAACIAVAAPGVLLTDADQGDYNVPLNGNAINILRAFPNRGPVVWGARTLDGNSNDYRYIQVRRTLVYIEQSIKAALQPFVFAANDDRTWAAVTSMIADFLTGVWQQGGLMGAKAGDAFDIRCGPGSTMTGQDILNGCMVIAVSLQMVHPAEFIELTFTQQVQRT